MQYTMTKNNVLVYDSASNQVSCRTPLEVIDVLKSTELDNYTLHYGLITANLEVYYAIHADGFGLRLLRNNVGPPAIRWMFYNTDVWDIGYTRTSGNSVEGKSKITHTCVVNVSTEGRVEMDVLCTALFDYYIGAIK